MSVMCCGCEKDLGDKYPEGSSGEVAEGALCGKCYKGFVKKTGVPLQQYLERIDVPTVCVTSKGLIGAANGQALELLGKSFEDIHGSKGGEVFECENASLPEGCGQTIHCSGCAIRRTITDTALTGESHKLVPAYLNPDSAVEDRRMELLISTEKIGGMVFLHVDRMKSMDS